MERNGFARAKKGRREKGVDGKEIEEGNNDDAEVDRKCIAYG